jgi:hypothetical protein
MKRPIAIGLATMALGIAAPVTYHVSQSAAESGPKAETPRASEGLRAEIAGNHEEARTFGAWIEGAQLVQYANAVHFFDYLEAVEEARLAAIAAAEAAAQQSSGGGGSSLDAIRQCESGGNYSAVSPSGQYRGAYQFDQQTWESVGGSGDPAAAPPAEQDARAAQLQARSGNSPWPNCG